MKPMRKSALTASVAIITVLGLSLATIAAAQPQFETTIVVRHGLGYEHQEGGGSVAYAQESNSSGWVPTWGGYFDQSADVAAEAGASTGVLRASARGSVRLNPICTPCSAGTPFATAEPPPQILPPEEPE